MGMEWLGLADLQGPARVLLVPLVPRIASHMRSAHSSHSFSAAFARTKRPAAAKLGI